MALRSTDSAFAAAIFSAIIVICLVTGYAVGRYARPSHETCEVVIKDDVGNKHLITGEYK